MFADALRSNVVTIALEYSYDAWVKTVKANMLSLVKLTFRFMKIVIEFKWYKATPVPAPARIIIIIS